MNSMKPTEGMRRGAPPGKHEDVGRLALLEPPGTGLARRLDERSAGATDLDAERAPVEPVEPSTAPPPAEEPEHDRSTRHARRRRKEQRHGGNDHDHR